MHLEPIQLVAPPPLSAALVPPRTFWLSVLGVLLGAMALGFVVTALSPSAPDTSTSAVDPLEEQRGWLEVRADLRADELLPDALAYIDAAASVRDARFLPAIERIAYAILEGDPALAPRRVELARAIIAHLPDLPPSAELDRMRAALEAVH